MPPPDTLNSLCEERGVTVLPILKYLAVGMYTTSANINIAKIKRYSVIPILFIDSNTNYIIERLLLQFQLCVTNQESATL